MKNYNKKGVSMILLAAGAGTRYGKQKQFELLQGKEIWKWSYDTFKNLVDKIVVVGVNIPGGKTRNKSVKNGLSKIDTKYGLVHDAARPLVQQEEIVELIKLLESGAQSATLTMPNSNTIIKGREGSSTYLDRDEVKVVATPQGFETSILKEAHRLGGQENAPDDCYLVQKYIGIRPKFVDGGSRLLKITFPGDLKLLEFYAGQINQEQL